MPLPGKLCVGILEEDNPLKSYFRFKPLLVEQEGKFQPFNDANEYPEDGCIRIVPDKNESSHFKNRMREIGRYCIVDLRDHPGDNDKIRPNKNYKGESGERNSHIIYSDVVREPAENTIFEILPVEAGADAAQMALVIPAPATRRVLIKTGGALGAHPWQYTPMKEPEGGFSLTREGDSVDVSAMQEFHLQGFQETPLAFAVVGPEVLCPAAPAPQETPASSVEFAGSPCLPEAAPAGPVEAEHPSKPWLSRESSPAQGVAAGMRALSAQSGLNPRRGRSLQEIVEDKWRHSRLDQLGQPVPAEAMGQPVTSPVEAAVSSLRQVWRLPAARASLLNALSDMDEFRTAALERQDALRQSDMDERLNDLEAKRLELLDETQRLEKKNGEIRARLKAQIRQEDAVELAHTCQEIDRAKRTLSALKLEADQTARAAQEAETRFAFLTEEQLEARLLDTALDNRALEMAFDLRKRHAALLPKPTTTRSPSAGELMDEVCAHLANNGLCGDRLLAANLLCCLTISPITIVSGPTGSGKSATVRGLAEALGLPGCMRFAEFRPGKQPLVENERFRAMSECPDATVPLIAMLDDANSTPHGDGAGGLATIGEGCTGGNPALRLFLTVQDGHVGFPMRAGLLDRAFLIRLKPEPADTPWRPASAGGGMEMPPISMEALQDAFAPVDESIPQEQILRVAKLRRDLDAVNAGISRRSLNATWRYMAAMLPLNVLSPAEALDMALAQRVLPALLATAPLEAQMRLSDLLSDMPACLALMGQPLAIDL